MKEKSNLVEVLLVGEEAGWALGRVQEPGLVVPEDLHDQLETTIRNMKR